MIQRISHSSVYVLDQDAAKAFYTEKLGFELRNDVKMDGFRWLTVPEGPARLRARPHAAAPESDDGRADVQHDP